MLKENKCKKVLKNTRYISIILIIIGFLYLFTVIFTVVFYEDMKIYAQEQGEDLTVNQVILVNSLASVFLLISGLGLLYKNERVMYFFSAIATFLFFWTLYNLLKMIMVGASIPIISFFAYFLLGISAIYLFRNRECFKQNLDHEKSTNN